MNLSNITPAHLAAASNNPDVNEAVRTLQDAAGIKHGDVAGIFFSGKDIDDTWPSMTPSARLALLKEYVAFESVHGED